MSVTFAKLRTDVATIERKLSVSVWNVHDIIKNKILFYFRARWDFDNFFKKRISCFYQSKLWTVFTILLYVIICKIDILFTPLCLLLYRNKKVLYYCWFSRAYILWNERKYKHSVLNIISFILWNEYRENHFCIWQYIFLWIFKFRRVCNCISEFARKWNNPSINIQSVIYTFMKKLPKQYTIFSMHIYQNKMLFH